MNKKPLLSVVVPVYKVEKFLKICLDSIINQTYQNLEIILIDDGSPDNSGKICDRYADKDKRVKVIHQKNSGLSGARNTGTEIAKGDYITYVDSDDWLDVRMYDILMKKIQQYDLDMARCAAYSSDGDSEETIMPKTEHKNIVLTGESIFERYFDEFLCKIVWNAVYKKEIVKGIISPEKCHSQDNYVSGMYLYRTKRMMIIDEPLYYYRKNPESITNSGERRSIDICICTNQLINDLLNIGFSNKRFLTLLYQKLARELFHFVRNKNQAYKTTSMTKEMFDFIWNNLNLRRKLQFEYIIKIECIKITDY